MKDLSAFIETRKLEDVDFDLGGESIKPLALVEKFQAALQHKKEAWGSNFKPSDVENHLGHFLYDQSLGQDIPAAVAKSKKVYLATSESKVSLYDMLKDCWHCPAQGLNELQ